MLTKAIASLSVKQFSSKLEQFILTLKFITYQKTSFIPSAVYEILDFQNWHFYRLIFAVFLKGQCHEIFWHFFISWIEAIWAPDKQAKMVLLKSSFSRRNSRKIRLRAVLDCAESKIEIFANPKLANTARSQTNFSIFENLHFQGI